VSWYAIPLVFGPELLDARRYLLLLLVAEILFTPFTVAAKGLVGGGWTRTVGLVGSAGGGLAIISYGALTPLWGVWGACLATCATYLVLSTVGGDGAPAAPHPAGSALVALPGPLPAAERAAGLLTMLTARAAARVRDRIQIARDPVAYARRIGVAVGAGCRLLGIERSTFGSEPYLVSLGDHVTVTSLVRFITHDGGVWVLRDIHPDIEVVGRVTVGDNVFIGLGSILLPGTDIGPNVVIGAGSVVTGAVPGNTVAVGIPARPVCSWPTTRRGSPTGRPTSAAEPLT
jgi:acetyltransferase-like isoleucine patch superfamily enzyme